MKFDINYDVYEGIAKDQETIVRLRSWMEDIAREEFGDFRHSELYWEMMPGGLFKYQLCFFK